MSDLEIWKVAKLLHEANRRTGEPLWHQLSAEERQARYYLAKTPRESILATNVLTAYRSDWPVSKLQEQAAGGEATPASGDALIRLKHALADSIDLR